MPDRFGVKIEILMCRSSKLTEQTEWIWYFGTMTAQEVLQELASYADDGIKKIFMNHGADLPLYGVRVGDMKKIQKKIKKDHDLSLELYATGNGDAMYFAGLIADESRITRDQLQEWVNQATWHMISEYTVAWVAAESPHGVSLALEWIESDQEHIAAAGWSTLASVASITDDDEVDMELFSGLLDRVAAEIDDAPNRVRYTMNGFVIAIGCYLAPLNEKAIATAGKIGKVDVDMNGTACKVPPADAYIRKVVDAGRLGKKRKMARC